MDYSSIVGNVSVDDICAAILMIEAGLALGAVAYRGGIWVLDAIDGHRERQRDLDYDYFRSEPVAVLTHEELVKEAGKAADWASTGLGDNAADMTDEEIMRHLRGE